MDFIAEPLDRQQIERLLRAVRLAVDRAEGGEIMLPDQSLRSAVHRLRIQRLGHLPGAIGIQRQRGAAVGDAIEIGAANARKPGVPITGLGPAVQHGNRSGAEVVVDRLHQPKRVDLLVHIDMNPHAKGVDPGISPTGSVERHSLTGNGVNGFLDRLLHRRAMGLPLQAHERRAIKLEGEGEAGQAILAPAVIAQPRNRSAVGMAGRPAR